MSATHAGVGTRYRQPVLHGVTHVRTGINRSTGGAGNHFAAHRNTASRSMAIACFPMVLSCCLPRVAMSACSDCGILRFRITSFLLGFFMALSITTRR